MGKRTGKGKHAAILTWTDKNGATRTHTFFHDDKTYAKQQAKDWGFYKLTPKEWKGSYIV